MFTTRKVPNSTRPNPSMEWDGQYRYQHTEAHRRAGTRLETLQKHSWIAPAVKQGSDPSVKPEGYARDPSAKRGWPRNHFPDAYRFRPGIVPDFFAACPVPNRLAPKGAVETVVLMAGTR